MGTHTDHILHLMDRAAFRLARLSERCVLRSRVASRSSLKFCAAALCKLAIILCVIEPCCESEVRSAEVQGAACECISEQDDRGTQFHGTCSQQSETGCGQSSAAAPHRVAANALSRSSAHLLANGLRAPLVC